MHIHSALGSPDRRTCKTLAEPPRIDVVWYGGGDPAAEDKQGRIALRRLNQTMSVNPQLRLHGIGLELWHIVCLENEPHRAVTRTL